MEPGLERVPAWDRFPWLRAAFSTRLGGSSQIHGTNQQNLGWTNEDFASSVASDRQAYVRAAAQESTMRLVTLQQVHGGLVRDVDSEAEPLMGAEGKALLQGDGLMTRSPGQMLGVVTADCVPVLVADTRQRAVAAFHAGWRGTVARIAQRGVEAMQQRYGSRAEDMIAAIGPSIGACCFSVGNDVRRPFEDEFPFAHELFSQEIAVHGAEPKTHIDLSEANRRQLLEAGVPAENISVFAECTACCRLDDGARKYFSHRAEQGFTGRMLSVIGVVPE